MKVFRKCYAVMAWQFKKGIATPSWIQGFETNEAAGRNRFILSQDSCTAYDGDWIVKERDNFLVFSDVEFQKQFLMSNPNAPFISAAGSSIATRADYELTTLQVKVGDVKRLL